MSRSGGPPILGPIVQSIECPGPCRSIWSAVALVSSRSRHFRRHRGGGLVLLGGDVETTTAQCSGQCPVASAAQTLSAPDPAPPRPATLGVFPRPRTDDVNPAAPVSVAAFSGTIYDVTMVNDSGNPVPGVLTRDRRGWNPAKQLGYGRTYTMTIAARGPGGMPSRRNLELHHPVARLRRPPSTSTPPRAPRSTTATPTASALSSSRTSTTDRRQSGRRAAPARHRQAGRRGILELGQRP